MFLKFSVSVRCHADTVLAGLVQGEDSGCDLVLGEGTGHAERTGVGEGHHYFLGEHLVVVLVRLRVGT